MFKSQPMTEQEAIGLLQSYVSWVNGVASQALGNARAKTTHLEAVNLKSKLGSYRDLAKNLVVDAKFATLTADLQDDVRALAEEAELALAELDEVTDVDRVWSVADKDTKARLLQRHSIEKAHADSVLARMKLQRRGQSQFPPDPPKK